MIDAKAILSMDMGTLAQFLRDGWSWWSAQLEALLPQRFRGAKAGSRLIAELADGEMVFHEYRSGEKVSMPNGLPGRLLPRAVLAVPPDWVLLRDLALPGLSNSDLWQLVALDIERLTPFNVDDVVFDLEIHRVPGPDGKKQATLALIPRKLLQDFADRVRGQWGMPAAISLVDGDTGTTRFEFLRRLDSAASSRRPVPASVGWWLAVIVLFALNLALLLGRDISATDSLQEVVTEQTSSANLATAVHRRVDVEEARRRLLLQRHRCRAQLPLLAAVTHALSDGTYVQRYEWNGIAGRLTGMAQPGIDVVKQLRTATALANVHADAAAAPSGAFDVTVAPRQEGCP